MKRRITVIGSVCLALALIVLSVVSCAEPTPTGGILRIARANEPATLGDPITNIPGGLQVAAPCIETLLRLDEEGNPVPWLATDWEVDADALTITLTLRKGVKFHDGTDFNAEAVKYNIERYARSDHPILHAVESVDVVDDYTARFNLSEFDSEIIGNLSYFSGMQPSPTAFETKGVEWCNTHPVGTGPFKFVGWERDVSIKYERFDDYWGGKPHLDGIEWVIIADPMIQLAAFKAGEVDAVVGLDPKDAKQLEVEGKYTIVTRGTGGANAIAGDASHPDSIYADIKVRQAVSHAIDWKAICETVGYGYWQPTNQQCGPGVWGYNPDLKGYPYNPDRARELLAEAGYPNGFKTKIICMNTPQSTVDALTAVQGYLSEVGIDAELDVAERGRFYQIIVGGGWEDSMVYVAAGAGVKAAFGLRLGMSSKSIAFSSMLHVPEVDEVIYEACATADFETKKNLVHEALRMITDDYCVTTVGWSATYIAAKHPYVHDDGIGLSAETYSFTPEDAWIEE